MENKVLHVFSTSGAECEGRLASIQPLRLRFQSPTEARLRGVPNDGAATNALIFDGGPHRPQTDLHESVENHYSSAKMGHVCSIEKIAMWGTACRCRRGPLSTTALRRHCLERDRADNRCRTLQRTLLTAHCSVRGPGRCAPQQ